MDGDHGHWSSWPFLRCFLRTVVLPRCVYWMVCFHLLLEQYRITYFYNPCWSVAPLKCQPLFSNHKYRDPRTVRMYKLECFNYSHRVINHLKSLAAYIWRFSLLDVNGSLAMPKVSFWSQTDELGPFRAVLIICHYVNISLSGTEPTTQHTKYHQNQFIIHLCRKHNTILKKKHTQKQR